MVTPVEGTRVIRGGSASSAPLPRVVHPWLFALFPVTFLFARNRDQLSFHDLVLPTVASLAIVGALWLGFRTWFGSGLGNGHGSSHCAALAATIVWIALWSYGYAVSVAFEYRLWPAAWGVRRFVLAAYALTVLLAVAYLARKARVREDREPRALASILNAVGVTLIAINLISLVGWQIRHRGLATRSATSATTVEVAESAPRPDIYYIVLDAFARDDVLRDRFGAKGPSFAEGLEARGFAVADRGFANYTSTFLSLTASLDMRYIEDMPPEETAWHMLNERIENNRLLRFLDARGYTTVHFRSGKGITNDNRFADLRYRGGRVDELSRLLLEQSLLEPVVRSLLATDRRTTVLHALEKLPSVAGIRAPTYTFVHILCPHPPFLFRADGTAQSQPVGDTRGAYLEQVAFIGDRVLEIVDGLLRETPRPIIVIQGDHGPSSTVDWDTASDDWRPSSQALIEERMPILNAAYLPGRDAESLLGDAWSPVNTFRVILSSYFDAELDRLPDRALFSSYALPYRFTDVTERLRRPTRPASTQQDGSP